MFTYYEVWYNNGAANMEKAGAYKSRADAINTAKIYHKSIVYQIDKEVWNHADGWSEDVNIIYKKDGDREE